MRQSKLTKVTALMLSMVMITSVFVGNTLSRYVTSVSSTDSARVAIWGINGGTTQMNLFKADYIKDGKSIAASNNKATDPEDKIMAPGTSGEAPFSIINFEQDVAPEVAYQVALTFDDSAIADEIKNNPSVQWKLDNGAWGTLEQLKTSILSLSGDASGVKVYEPGQFADAFEDNTPHTISWQWLLDNNETITVEVCDDEGNNCTTVTKTSSEYDTYMGNLALTGDLEAVVTVGITATQIDDLVTNGYILDGANQTVNLNDIRSITIRSASDINNFESVKVDGNPLTEGTHYTKTEGSTVIKLSKDFLSTLDKGSHIIDIISSDMTATTKFMVEDGPVVHNDVIPQHTWSEYLNVYYYRGIDGVYNEEYGYTIFPLDNYETADEIFATGDNFPEDVQEGDTYVYGPFEYRYNMIFMGDHWVPVSFIHEIMEDMSEEEKAEMKKELGEIKDGWSVRFLLENFYSNSYIDFSILTSINGKDVTNMFGAFSGFENLLVSPEIPDTVVNLNNAFSGCTSLEEVVNLPKSLVTMDRAFYECESLTKVPDIPNTVISMIETFYECESLVNAPKLSNNVIDMDNTFAFCASLVEAPVIPDSVTNMHHAFYDCESLVNAPVIPSNVTNIESTFWNCKSLTGTIEINANPTDYDETLHSTIKPIILTGSSILLNEIAATANRNNVTVAE